jgi:hypothetical protein
MAAALDDETEKPLDPAVENVRRKMVRMLLVTMGVTFLGLMAVVAALVYRVSERREDPAVAVEDAVPVPVGEGRALADAALDAAGERALLRLSGTAGDELLLLDLASGTVVGRFPLTP